MRELKIFVITLLLVIVFCVAVAGLILAMNSLMHPPVLNILDEL